MPAGIALHFDRVSTKGSHNDLRLRIGLYQQNCDSYYFGLDEAPTAPGGLGARLARLLDQWSSQIAGLGLAGGTAYLPFDFSDQCTAWLRVSSEDGQAAEVQAGWTLIEGWSISPSDYLAAAAQVQDFDPIPGARIQCSLGDLAAQVDANRSTLVATGP
ncbi:MULTISPECIES: hypothetical protein [unclassified Streptomyces]|uniref:hypothetical protein n=1 Tax=unclassified Streptomyces TaxID=2593676 RepID=UPI0033A93E53